MLIAQHVAKDNYRTEDSEKFSEKLIEKLKKFVESYLHVVKMDTVSGPKCLMVKNMKYCPRADIRQNAPNLKSKVSRRSKMITTR